MIINLLFYFFCNILLLSSLMTVVTQNPVYSVLFLVLSFVSASGLLFLLECEFIALIFLIIYVGAIAILFLFVVMMLNVKTTSVTKDFLKYFPFGSFVVVIFLLEIVFVVLKNFKANPYNNSFLFNYSVNWYEKVDSLTDIYVIGQILYTHYVLQFLIAGNILLMAVLGTVVLINTAKTKLRKQIVFKQLSRNYKNALFNSEKLL